MKKKVFIGVFIAILLIGVLFFNSLKGKGDDLVREDQELSKIVDENISVKVPKSELNNGDSVKDVEAVDEDAADNIKELGEELVAPKSGVDGLSDVKSSRNINEGKEEGAIENLELKGASNKVTNQGGIEEELEQNEVVFEVTADSLKDKYKPSFEELDRQARDKLESMLDVALKEYKTKKRIG
ncbi:hypothetical protein QTG56_22560 (plasmid) [Rossellomorea sp. AcN35-11]|nr:hypothetical protein QTG56_22560 [Rossellomorea sp. AcN35-11]